MSRRSHSTVRATERARSATHDALVSEREQRSRLGHMLSALPSFATKAVLARLDQADATDRAAAERRLAKLPPRVDLGEP